MYGIYNNGEVIARFVTPLTLKSNRPIFTSDTLSLKRHTRTRTPQRWEINTRLEPLYRGAEELMSLLITTGYENPVPIIMPQNVGAKLRRSSTSPTPLAGATVVGLSVVPITGVVGMIPNGTFIKFANHSKVYMLTADRNGNGNMNIYPPLRMALPAATGFTFKDDVIMSCLFDTDTIMGMVYEDGILMDCGTIKLIERL